LRDWRGRPLEKVRTKDPVGKIEDVERGGLFIFLHNTKSPSLEELKNCIGGFK